MKEFITDWVIVFIFCIIFLGIITLTILGTFIAVISIERWYLINFEESKVIFIVLKTIVILLSAILATGFAVSRHRNQFSYKGRK